MMLKNETATEGEARSAYRSVHASAAIWLLLGLAPLITGCRRVAPYQRARLAHPTMEAAFATSKGREHMRGVNEGAIGGGEGATSGCGCN